MLYEITEQTIQAIKNMNHLVEYIPATPGMVSADDVIIKQSVDELHKIVHAWEHDKHMFEDCFGDTE